MIKEHIISSMENTSDVASIMTRKVVTVEMDDDLQVAREILQNVEFHHILVVEKGRLVGVVSDRDLLKRLCPWLDKLSEKPHGRQTLNVKVHQIMSHKLITVSRETNIKTAARLILKNNISCLPVVSPQCGIEGIVTWKDILGFYMKH